MSKVKTKDGVEIFYKDWARGSHRFQPWLATLGR